MEVLRPLDTPGILWPKIEDRNVGERLAMIGSINDQILNIEELALETIKFLRKNYQPQLYSRYDITEDIFDNVDTETMMNPENAAALCIMEHIARKRGCIKKGSDIDYEKCALHVFLMISEKERLVRSHLKDLN